MPMAEKIRIALIKRNMNLKELSSRLGCTSQNLSGKLKRDNFSERELTEIAEVLGYRYEGRLINKETGEEI